MSVTELFTILGVKVGDMGYIESQDTIDTFHILQNNRGLLAGERDEISKERAQMAEERKKIEEEKSIL